MTISKPNMSRIWASSAPGANVVDPDTQVASKFVNGWQAEIPPFEWFNFIQNHVTQSLAHINEQGVPLWDINTTYEIGSLVKGSNNIVYRSLKDNNLGNSPTTNTDRHWLPDSNCVTVEQFGAISVATGGTLVDCSQAFIDARDYLFAYHGGGTILTGTGDFGFNADFGLPNTHNGFNIVSPSRGSTRYMAMQAGVSILRVSSSDCIIKGMTISGNGLANTFGAGCAPEDLTNVAGAAITNNYNTWIGVTVRGCTEGLLLQCGHDDGTSDSNCFYNTFIDVHLRNNTRCLWLKSGPNAGSSSPNANRFYGLRCGQDNTNIGIDIESGDSNMFFGAFFEGIGFGTSPYGTPTALRIAQTDSNGIDNNDNMFFGSRFETCTRDLDINTNRVQMYGTTAHFSNSVFGSGVFPSQIFGSDTSVMPQKTAAYEYTQGQSIGTGEAIAQAMFLPDGRLQFPATANLSGNANTIDDFELGVFTPTISASTPGTPTYSVQKGRYRKLASEVAIKLEVQLSALSGLSGGSVVIQGLPFSSDASATNPITPFEVLWGNLQGGTAGEMPKVQVVPGDNTLTLKILDANDEVGSNFPASRLQNDSFFRIEGSYETAG